MNESSLRQLVLTFSFDFARYIVYKLPKIRESDFYYVKEGLGYAYMDENKRQFAMIDKPISSDKSAVGLTLQQIYQSRYKVNGLSPGNIQSRYVGYVMYNDAKPEGIHLTFSLHRVRS